MCRRHLTVVLSLHDRTGDLESRILAIDPEQTRKLSDTDFKDFYSDLTYSYWSNEKTVLFRHHLARLGGGSLTVSDSDWMSCVERLYQLLRNSQFA